MSTSVPLPKAQEYLTLAHSIRGCEIDGRPIYRKYTPTFFYPNARQAAFDQLPKTQGKTPSIDFKKTPVVAVFGELHAVCHSNFRKMQRIIVSIDEIDPVDLLWSLSNAAALLHMRQYRDFQWSQKDARKAEIASFAVKIYQQLTERSHDVGQSNRPAGVCRTGTTGRTAER